MLIIALLKISSFIHAFTHDNHEHWFKGIGDCQTWSQTIEQNPLIMSILGRIITHAEKAA